MTEVTRFPFPMYQFAYLVVIKKLEIAFNKTKKEEKKRLRSYLTRGHDA